MRKNQAKILPTALSGHSANGVVVIGQTCVCVCVAVGCGESDPGPLRLPIPHLHPWNCKPSPALGMGWVFLYWSMFFATVVTAMTATELAWFVWSRCPFVEMPRWPQ